MVNILRLIRWKNLLLIALAQVLVKYSLLVPFYESHGVKTALSDLAFGLLVISTLCIAAAGYVINDIYDIEADEFNKPNAVIVGKSISEKVALALFIILNVIGVGLGFYLSNGIGQSGFFGIFFIVSALLYLYSSYLKYILFVGTLVVSLMVATSIILVGIFELLPAITDENRTIQITFFKIIFDYAIFAFIISVLRELIKDMEDIDGDYKMGVKTMPIALGRERAGTLIFILSFVPIIAVTYYVITYLFKQLEAVLYFLILVIGPLLYVSIKLFNAQDKWHFAHLSTILKLIMLTGMLSMLVYPFILK